VYASQFNISTIIYRYITILIYFRIIFIPFNTDTITQTKCILQTIASHAKISTIYHATNVETIYLVSLQTMSYVIIKTNDTKSKNIYNKSIQTKEKRLETVNKYIEIRKGFIELINKSFLYKFRIKNLNFEFDN